MGEAEALRSLWIRLHNQSRQKKNPGRRIPTFAIYLFPPVLDKVEALFFPPAMEQPGSPSIICMQEATQKIKSPVFT